MTPIDAHPAIKHEEARLLAEEPKTNAWACMLVLTLTVAMMAVTADFVSYSTCILPSTEKLRQDQLVESIEHVREEHAISEEWARISSYDDCVTNNVRSCSQVVRANPTALRVVLCGWSDCHSVLHGIDV